MWLPVVLTLIAPLILILQRRKLGIEVPLPLAVTIAATLISTSFAMMFLLRLVDDPFFAIVLFFVAAPLVATPVAAVTACSLTRTSGFAVATGIMALGGWMLGLIGMFLVDVVLGPSHEPGELFMIIRLLMIPASVSGTCAVYAAALGKVKTAA